MNFRNIIFNTFSNLRYIYSHSLAKASFPSAVCSCCCNEHQWSRQGAQTLEEAEHLGRTLWETLPVTLAMKPQQLEIGSVPLSRCGNLEAVVGLCAGNENGTMSCAASALLFPVAPHSAPDFSEVTKRTHVCVTLCMGCLFAAHFPLCLWMLYLIDFCLDFTLQVCLAIGNY